MTKRGLKAKKEGREGFYEKYEENPFLYLLRWESESKTKKAYGVNNKYAPVDERNILDKEYKTDFQAVGFRVLYEKAVETNKFIKLFEPGIWALLTLPNAARKVFAIVLLQLLRKKEHLSVVLYYNNLPPEVTENISQSVFSNGINQLVEFGFLACSTTPLVYFVNPVFVYNGNRLKLAEKSESTNPPPLSDEDKQIQENVAEEMASEIF